MSSRGHFNPRGVKRKMSNFNVRRRGIANAAEIASASGVDAVFIGPNDLAHAMGHGSNWRSAEVQAAIERGLRAITAAGNCAGTIALSREDEARYAQWGTRYFANVSSSIITHALKAAARSERGNGGVGLKTAWMPGFRRRRTHLHEKYDHPRGAHNSRSMLRAITVC